MRGYLMGRTPITNATYLTFTEGGGYERREWWSDEGWHWKEQYDITRPGGWTADHAAEWHLGTPGIHAGVDQLASGPAPAGAYPTGASPHGCLGTIGDVWEWTASDLDGYPEFAAYPYREYSQVFFGSDYKVLRGGSWATRARVITPTFRNWDYPQRRQIFSGFRIARDA